MYALTPCAETLLCVQNPLNLTLYIFLNVSSLFLALNYHLQTNISSESIKLTMHDLTAYTYTLSYFPYVF